MTDTESPITHVFIGSWQSWRRYHTDMRFEFDPRRGARRAGWLVVTPTEPGSRGLMGTKLSRDVQIVDKGFLLRAVEHQKILDEVWRNIEASNPKEGE